MSLPCNQVNCSNSHIPKLVANPILHSLSQAPPQIVFKNPRGLLGLNRSVLNERQTHDHYHLLTTEISHCKGWNGGLRLPLFIFLQLICTHGLGLCPTGSPHAKIVPASGTYRQTCYDQIWPQQCFWFHMLLQNLAIPPTKRRNLILLPLSAGRPQ